MSRVDTEALRADRVLLGTVALEPNRWGAISPDRRPSLRCDDWLERAVQAGFDGVELWEHHAMLAGDQEVARLQASPLPIAILSSYASFDEEEDAARGNVAEWANRLGCAAIKFNLGNERRDVTPYIERLARFADQVSVATRLICECHGGTAADDPAVAEKILSAVGGAERIQALVHLGDEPDHLDAMFDALGERIQHVHVNFLRQGAPRLSEIADDVEARIARIRRRGFFGSYTLEFVNGVGTERDRPAHLIEAAVSDLGVMRQVLR